MASKILYSAVLATIKVPKANFCIIYYYLTIWGHKIVLYSALEEVRVLNKMLLTNQ
jgi:hypothetical protein